MKSVKVMSHAEAMCVNNRPVFNRVPLNAPYEARIDGYSMDDRGIARKVSKCVMVDPKEEMAKFRVSDFCLENVIAAGAVGDLRETTLSVGALEGSMLVDDYVNKLEAFDNNNSEKNDD